MFIHIFFCKQKTAYEMRISDWSSDVCSSDLRRVLGRDDEPEMMPVVLSPLGEGLGIGRLRLRPEQLRLLPVPGDALALQVVEVGGERRRASALPDDARLDDRVAGSAGQEPVGLQGRALAASEAGAVSRADLAGARDPAA